ncbi:hypothetical protein HAPAU_26920 [Halalkalicoccus paucihalophilus]|uniref:Uncharacterized protein n=1 Tax=Halalkalicoccus paucihalophilus TaxID=1008153 RepID=A0A151ABW2_9EURY|nr:hypothetical protein [Halalkalicoccus paucihalophilus]KYH25109.1 hypothetical protein HAPAU_26920 [Halalkalicoccus paucihalophilus]
MKRPKEDGTGIQRRPVIRAMAGFAAAGAVGTASVGTAAGQIERGATTDPHTKDTYRSIVEAVVPETPELAAERGDEHRAGGLAIDLDEYLIWSFNNFQEIQLGASSTAGSTLINVEDLLEDSDSLLGGLTDVLSDATLGVLDVDALVGAVDFGDVELDLGPLQELAVGVSDGTFELAKSVESEVYDLEFPTYPYSEVTAVVFDIVAAEFLARGMNEESPSVNPEYPAGGIFTRLAPRDRLRAIESMVDGGLIDIADEILEDLIVHVGFLKFVVFGVNGFAQFGYYSEWSGYGETKTDPPTQRIFEGGVQSHEQTDYPGPAAGYAELREFPGDGVFDFGEDGFKENEY